MSSNNSYVRPSWLVRGDKVGLIAPAACPDPSALLQGIQLIESWGFHVQQGKHLLINHTNYLAADDVSRLHDMQSMLDDPAIRAIFCARGGYGSTRIIDALDFTRFLISPKWIIGFSDITAIHLLLHRFGVESIHGCMPVQFNDPVYQPSVEALKRLLQGEKTKALEASHHPLNRLGEASGRIVGGNLSLIIDSLETANSIETMGRLLLIEETGEPLYKLDRMLTHLKRAKKLTNIAGLIIGNMTYPKIKSDVFGSTVEEIVMDKLEKTTYPIAFCFPVGHTPPNFPWRHSSEAVLQVGTDQSTVIFR